ncbi:CAP domain-containing protein [Actinoallomurus purpureus]|uniref:CAP domain-containing protein n=1 Tax=Actinoallomurus purpureus TaxID=478114 RepID=UPI002093311E|nr:CAP domain-containing protein [Actinoallomurus purpureus]MCO6004588.1 CAP domain-containing protein [Actinoallomurus purpureus]
MTIVWLSSHTPYTCDFSRNAGLAALRGPIVLVLRSPQEDPLSAKRVKRRVQAFVLLAIAVFVSGGVAARSLWSAAQQHTPSPVSTPARDMAVVPSPEGAAVRPSAGPSSARPSHVARRSKSPTAKRKPPTHSATPRATRSTTAAAPAKGGSAGASAESTAVSLTNAQRAAHGCSALRVDTRLRTAARNHSADMRERNYFEHDSPDGRTPWDRIKAAGYTVPGAENIAKGYPTAQAVVQGWMNSPGHRANILNCKLKAVGIGVEYGSGGPWWTQDFGFK